MMQMTGARTAALVALVIGPGAWSAPAGAEVAALPPREPGPTCAEIGGCEHWVSRDPSQRDGLARAVVEDPTGEHLFVTGSANDPDQSTGIVTLSLDAATGDQRWKTRWDGPSEWAGAAAIAVHPSGSLVYAVGFSEIEWPRNDYVTLAYDADSGEIAWERSYNGPGVQGMDFRDHATAVAADPGGERVYVTGWSYGDAATDFATIAYDAWTGEELWVVRHPGVVEGSAEPMALVAHPDEEVLFATGRMTLDGSVGYGTVAYDGRTGEELWTAVHPAEGPAHGGSANALDLHPDGRLLYVTGESNAAALRPDYLTIAYDTRTGAEAWSARYEGTGRWDQAQALAVDPLGARVFVTGASQNDDAFYDHATVAYDADTGAELWVARYGGLSGDWARAIGTSPDGSRVYVTGYTTRLLIGQAYTTHAYDAVTGERLWTARYDGTTGTGGHVARDLLVAGDGSRVYVTGASPGETSADYVTVAYYITEPPQARLIAEPTGGLGTPAPVRFHLRADDPDGEVVRWWLDVTGDGRPDYAGEGGPPAAVSHTYEDDAPVTARLTVADDRGAVGRDTVRITPVIDPLPAAVEGDTLTVSGTAFFAGQPAVAVATGAAGDGPVHPEVARAAGADLTEARVHQPDPDAAVLVLEWQATHLPEAGSLPEAVRYGWSFTASGGSFLLQAKLSNLASSTVAQDPQGHVRAGAFQLLGDCFGDEPDLGCRHVAWLDGEFDTARDVVRVRLPLAAAPELRPGAVLAPSRSGGHEPIYAAFQAVTSPGGVRDELAWEDGDAYPVPEKQVSVGVAPAGTDPDLVAFTVGATLDAGNRFAADLDLGGLAAGAHEVHVRACFGDLCTHARAPFTHTPS